MQQSSMICGHCRGGFLAPAHLFVSGGAITCPHCHHVNVVGGQRPVQVQHSPPPAPAQRSSSTPTYNRAGVALAVLVGSVGCVLLVPTLAFVVGLLGTIGAGAYLGAGKLRPRVDRLLRLDTHGPLRRLLGAGGALALGLLLCVGATQVWRAQAEEAEQQRVATEAAAAQRAADEAARDDLIARAEAELAAGQLDRAQGLLDSAADYPDSDAARAARGRLADALHQRELDGLPDLLAEIDAHSQAREWDAALRKCARAKAIDGAFAGLTAACDAATEGQRVASIPGWIDAALAVADDESKCSTSLDIAEAWTNLRQVRTDDPGYAKAKAAAAKLERCRKRTERELSDGIQGFMIKQRETWAANFEQVFLEDGLDVRVTLSGSTKNRATIRWVLMSRVQVHQLTEAGLLTQLENIGFAKVTFTDGYFESWAYELEPESERDGGKAVLAEMGLDRPLKL